MALSDSADPSSHTVSRVLMQLFLPIPRIGTTTLSWNELTRFDVFISGAIVNLDLLKDGIPERRDSIYRYSS